jgi:putative hydrolase of HD superfamily
MKYESIMSLKELVRTGWMLRGVPPAVSESVAEHIFEVSFLTLIISKKLIELGAEVDLSKSLTLAVIHDIPEAVTGDIVKWSKDLIMNSTDLDTRALERLGLNDFIELYKELEAEGSIESHIVKLADYLATALQSKRYMRRGYYAVSEIYVNTLEKAKKLTKESEFLSPYTEALLRYIDSLFR